MSEPKTLSLTLGERLGLLRIINSFPGGDMPTMKALLDDVKLFVIENSEWEEAGLVKTPTDAEISNLSPEERSSVTQTLSWNDEKVNKEVALQELTVKYLKDSIQKKSDEKQITFEDKSLVSFFEKL